eukprot:364085-Hanusia_phi.AAC.1
MDAARARHSSQRHGPPSIARRRVVRCLGALLRRHGGRRGRRDGGMAAPAAGVGDHAGREGVEQDEGGGEKGRGGAGGSEHRLVQRHDGSEFAGCAGGRRDEDEEEADAKEMRASVR